MQKRSNRLKRSRILDTSSSNKQSHPLTSSKQPQIQSIRQSSSASVKHRRSKLRDTNSPYASSFLTHPNHDHLPLNALATIAAPIYMNVSSPARTENISYAPSSSTAPNDHDKHPHALNTSDLQGPSASASLSTTSNIVQQHSSEAIDNSNTPSKPLDPLDIEHLLNTNAVLPPFSSAPPQSQLTPICPYSFITSSISTTVLLLTCYCFRSFLSPLPTGVYMKLVLPSKFLKDT